MIVCDMSPFRFTETNDRAGRRHTGEGPAPEQSVPMALASGLRYGENPHQGAAFYVDRSLAEAGRGGVATAAQHHGKEMSYNNYLDADAAYGAVCDYSGACLPLPSL